MHRTDRRFPILISFALVILAIGAIPGRAQTAAETTPVLAAGDTLRVWAPTARLDGVIATFARIDARDIFIMGSAMNPSSPPPPFAVPINAIQRMEVLRGGRRSTKRILIGVVVGGAAGALIGGPMGRIIECGGACDKSGDLQPMVGRGLGTAIGGAVGGLIGGVIGGTVRAKWQPVSISVR